jgi:hypothetical protein
MADEKVPVPFFPDSSNSRIRSKDYTSGKWLRRSLYSYRIPDTMKNNKQTSLLKDFVSGYFHEDWLCDSDSSDVVVDRYLKTSTMKEAHALGEAILEYSKRSQVIRS